MIAHILKANIKWWGKINSLNLLVHFTVKPALSDHSKRRQKLALRPILAECRSKVLHFAILLTFIKLPYALFCLFLSGRLRQAILYL